MDKLGKMKVSLLALILLCSASYANAAIVSSISYDGDCITLPKEKARVAGVGETLVSLVASSVVKGTLTFVSGWLSSFEKSFEGSDTAASTDGFYCKPKVGTLGHKQYITYKRTLFSKNKSTGKMEKSGDLILLKSKVKVFLENGVAGKGVFTITPSELNYSSPIAKRGSTKDMTITYAFELLGSDGEWQTIAIDPIVIKSLKKGDKLTNLEEYLGSSFVGGIPSNINLKSISDGKEEVMWAPFKFSLTIAESTEGNGVKLASKISNELSAAIETDKDDLASKIVNVIIGNKEEATPEEGSETGSDEEKTD